MIRVPAGFFTMGSPQSEDGHQVWERRRKVSFVNDFYLGKTPVTQDQDEAVTGTNPTDHQRLGMHRLIRWTGIRRLLSKAHHHEAGVLPDNWEYRLPTEAECLPSCRMDFGANFSPLDNRLPRSRR